MTRKQKHIGLIVGGIAIIAVGVITQERSECERCVSEPNHNGPHFISEHMITTRPNPRYLNPDGSFNQAKFLRENGELIALTTNAVTVTK